MVIRRLVLAVDDEARDIALSRLRDTGIDATFLGQVGRLGVYTVAGQELGLSRQQLRVLELIAEGLNYGEIGRALKITEDSVKAHTQRVFRKLGVHDRPGAVGAGFRRGLLGGGA